MIKTTYTYTQNKNLVWNKYILFDSSHFSHSDCRFSPEKCRQANIVGRKIVVQSGLEPATFGLQASRVPDRARLADKQSGI